MPQFKDSDVSVSNPSSEVDLLRSLLVSPEMAAVIDLREVLDELRTQIKDPEQLIGLILPVFTEILSLKVGTSGPAVAKAIAPIIDKAIQEKTIQDRESIAEVIGSIIIEALRKEIRVSPAEMAVALAPISSGAIARQHASSPQEVAHDLAPIIGGAIKEQIRSERDTIVDALYPVIGSTIAKYMSETLNNLVQTINVKIEQSLSVQGLLRKARARLKGVSETELLLKESLPCKVDAVFLIHKASGLVIAQSQNPNARLVDSDLLSGMLTAIRSLFNESLARSGRMSELDQIEYGQSKIILEVAGYCYLACVVNGEPSEDFIKDMRKTLADIVSTGDVAIQSYNGDSLTIPTTIQEKLNSLLSHSPGGLLNKSRKPYPFLVALGLAFLLILIPFGIKMYRDSEDRDLQTRIAAAVQSSFPGDHIEVAVERNKLELAGTVVNEYIRTQAGVMARGFAPASEMRNMLSLQEQPSLHALAVAKVNEITSVLNGVDGVFLTTALQGGDLLLAGQVADARLATQVQRAFERLPGISTITSRIDVQPPAVESRIYFDVGSSSLKPSEKTKIMLLRKWLDRNPLVRLRVIGHNDQTGPDAINRRLAQNRASTIRDALVKTGVSAARLESLGGSDEVPGAQSGLGRSALRCVRFEIVSESATVQR